MTTTITEAADQGTIGRLAQIVEDFRAYYDRITDVRYGAAIARLHDNQLMHDYGKAVNDAELMKRRIEAVTGAWENIKQWAGLSAIPLIPIAVAVGLIAAIGATLAAGRAVMRRADIALALKQDPDLTYEQAAAQVDRAHQGPFSKALDVAQLGIIALIAFIAYKIFSRG